MPFTHYGVIAGTLQSHHRDDPDDFGRWYHVHLRIDDGARVLKAAIDIDSKNSAVGVRWKVLKVTGKQIPLPQPLDAGYTALASAPDTGALDVLRHRALRTIALTRVLLRWLALGDALPATRKWIGLPILRPWRSGSHIEATQALEALLRVGARALVWGEPFPNGSPASRPVEGLHNVHQNQGDPIDSQWADENGIWQDGGVALEQPDGSWRLFLSKFSTQSDETDDDGHPV
jgi:hypothetical protein